MTMRVSVFHKESTEKEKVGKDVQRKAFLAAHWLMKEEVPNKIPDFNDGTVRIGLHEVF